MSPQLEAGKWFVGEFDKYKPVTAAYWLQREGTDDWYLHVASDEIDAADIPAAYGEVLRIAEEATNPGIDPFRVKVVRADDPVARALVDFTNRYPGKRPFVMGATKLGGVWVDGAIVYMPPFTAKVTA